LLSFRMKKKWADQFKIWVQLFRWLVWLRYLRLDFFLLSFSSFFFFFSFLLLLCTPCTFVTSFIYINKNCSGDFPHYFTFKKKKFTNGPVWSLVWKEVSYPS
jgi:hypothetical protein